jgi:hypothetical protein
MDLCDRAGEIFYRKQGLIYGIYDSLFSHLPYGLNP